MKKQNLNEFACKMELLALQQQMSVPASASSGDCIVHMRSSLDAVLTAMRSSGTFDPDHTAEAEQIIGSLVAGVDQIAAIARKKAANKFDQSKPRRELRRAASDSAADPDVGDEKKPPMSHELC